MIINEEAFKEEIEKIIDERTKSNIDKNVETMSFLLQEIYRLEERIKCLERKRMTFVDEKLIDDYLAEGYDRIKDDEATEFEDRKSYEGLDECDCKKCECCNNEHEEEELDLVKGEWLCRDCEEDRKH